MPHWYIKKNGNDIATANTWEECDKILTANPGAAAYNYAFSGGITRELKDPEKELKMV